METDNNHILTDDTQGLGFFEIKIETELSGDEFNLGNMSLDTTKAVKDILESLINLVEYENGNSGINLKLGLESGSACHRIWGSDAELDIFHNEIEKVFNNADDRKNEYVAPLKIIHSRLADRGATVTFQKSTEPFLRILTPLFERTPRTRRPRIIEERYFFVEFFEGIMENIGGTTPNFHINVLGQPTYTIFLDIEDAIKLKHGLYSTNKVSAFKQIRRDKPHYTFCDYYVDTSVDYFSDLKSFFSTFYSKDNEVDKIVFLTEKLVEVYKSGDYGHAKKLIRLFLDDSVFPSYLMTILRVSKAFRNNDSMSEILEETRIKLSNLMEDY
ncbi:hypothetical protein [Myroides odoratimimus]|uniref:hypothetical protein n=1 Tax=Myroides odoratimimus TaxID=76832 RepID=UPI002574B1C7|nr:hypothetical protein [Myroides odoratimimus]MDM1536388.1 hypothetical protein [Myroides odoratimimus]MDM1676052.1 hypothetical protein [Myroides odoratimimus]